MKKFFQSSLIICFIFSPNYLSAKISNDVSELAECLRENTGKIENMEIEIKELKNIISVLQKRLDEKDIEDSKKKLEEQISKKSPDEIIKLSENYIKEGKGKAARELLDAFIQKNPKNIYCGMMFFYKGESFFNEKNYESAAVEYRNGYQTNPNSAKAAKTLYQLALCFEKLSKTEEALKILKKIIRDYPKKTDEIKLAKQKLQNLEVKK